MNLRKIVTGSYFALTALCGPLSASFVQTNLVSDIPGLAANLDPSLKNPWGMSFTATSPFWVSDQGTSLATLYNGAGTKQGLVVTTPASPTGQVANGSTSFALPTGGKALFLFSSLSGTVSGWNGGTTAVTEFTSAGSAFTGLAIGNNGTGDFLYVADFANNKIDVLNSTFGLTNLSGSFTDPNLPAGYSAYNVQAIGSKLYVEYAKTDPVTHRAATTPNTGIVTIFDLNGANAQELVVNSHLNSPWGITLAPSGFGPFGGDLLVGNFGDGTISAFDPVTGAFQGTVSDQNGNPLVNSGLWALNFRAVGSGFDPNALFLNAGINGEADGLFAEVQFTPEPSTIALFALGLGAVALLRRKKRVRG
jgi:uncharacterized protein (TIGR03118 family)